MASPAKLSRNQEHFDASYVTDLQKEKLLSYLLTYFVHALLMHCTEQAI